MRKTAIFFVFAVAGWAQCAMCFRNAESQTRAHADAMNKGILVLALPLAAGIGAVAWLAYSRRARVITTGGVSVCPDAADI